MRFLFQGLRVMSVVRPPLNFSEGPLRSRNLPRYRQGSTLGRAGCRAGEKRLE